jgi:hypothetical protein
MTKAALFRFDFGPEKFKVIGESVVKNTLKI